MNNICKIDRFGFGMLAAVLCSLPLSVRAADVSLYAVYKRQVYFQADAGAPALQCSPYIFNAVVEPTGSNSVTAAVLTAPNTNQIPLAFWHENEILPRRWLWAMCAIYPTQTALDAAWPNGNYSFSISGATDGLKTPALNLPGDFYPPKPPHIQNYLEAQMVDASQDFVLRWDAFESGTTSDFVLVAIRNKADCNPVFNTPFLEEPNNLNGTATSVVIPAGTLKPGEHYDAYVRFDKIIARDTTSYPGAIGHVSYAKGTHCSLNTTPIFPPPSPPPTNLPLVNIMALDPIAAKGTNSGSGPVALPPFLTNSWSCWTNFIGTNTATFLVRRSGGTNSGLTVFYSIGGTATNGGDYQTLPGTVTIPAGQRTARITVIPIDNINPFPCRQQTVVLKLQMPTNLPPDYSVGWPGKAAAIIMDRDQPCPPKPLLDGCFHFQVPATNGFWFRVECSTNLVNWLPLCTNIVDRGAIHFVDPDANDSAQRFYRSVPVQVPGTWPE